MINARDGLIEAPYEREERRVGALNSSSIKGASKQASKRERERGAGKLKACMDGPV